MKYTDCCCSILFWITLCLVSCDIEELQTRNFNNDRPTKLEKQSAEISTGMHQFTQDANSLKQMFNEVIDHIVLYGAFDIGTFYIDISYSNLREIPIDILLNADNYNLIDMVGSNANFDFGQMVMTPKEVVTSYISDSAEVFILSWKKYSYLELEELFQLYDNFPEKKEIKDSLLAIAYEKNFLYIGHIGISQLRVLTTEFLLEELSEVDRIEIISSNKLSSIWDQDMCELCEPIVNYNPDGHSWCFRYYMAYVYPWEGEVGWAVTTILSLNPLLALVADDIVACAKAMAKVYATSLCVNDGANQFSICIDYFCDQLPNQCAFHLIGITVPVDETMYEIFSSNFCGGRTNPPTSEECDDFSDKDGDFIPDLYDNCPEIPNSYQDDWNFNDIGDACEDYDGDGIADRDDNCVTKYNPYQIDSDSDGIGDCCDNCIHIYNPEQDSSLCDFSDLEDLLDSLDSQGCNPDRSVMETISYCIASLTSNYIPPELPIYEYPYPLYYVEGEEKTINFHTSLWNCKYQSVQNNFGGHFACWWWNENVILDWFGNPLWLSFFNDCSEWIEDPGAPDTTSMDIIDEAISHCDCEILLPRYEAKMNYLSGLLSCVSVSIPTKNCGTIEYKGTEGILRRYLWWEQRFLSLYNDCSE